mgnify:CR=1 FL=1
MELSRLYELVEERRQELGLTQAQLSMLAFDRADTAAIQNLRRGKAPSVTKMAKIAEAVGLEFYIGPARSERSTSIPVRAFASCSTQGWGKADPVADDRPAPSSTPADAFWVIAMGFSMRPEGIEGGNYCLVDPTHEAVAGDRVFIKEQGSGRTSIKRLVEIDGEWIVLRGWMPPIDGSQQDFEERRLISSAEQLHPITSVVRGTPGHPAAQFLPDPRASSALDAAPLIEMSAIRLMSAGDPTSEDLTMISLPTSWLAARGVTADMASLHRVKGTSMAPRIPEDAIVLIDHTILKVAGKGGIFIFEENGGHSVKRLVRTDDTLMVISEDHEITPRLLAGEDIKSIRVIGRVAAVISEV